jgi:hypothetical protein
MKKFQINLCFILIVFLPGLAFCQSPVKGIYTAKNNFCSASFLFLPGGLFYYEGGCEDRSSILKGAYKTSEDSVQLFADPSPLRYNIESAGAITRSERTLTIVDVEGVPLSYFKIVGLRSSVKRDTLENMQVLTTDSNGVVKIDTREIAFVSFERFSTLRVNKDNRYAWRSLASLAGNDITVQFNYHRFCLKYPEIKVAGALSNLKRNRTDDTLADNQQNIYARQKQ